MFRFSSPVTVTLERGQLLAWRHPSGARLRVVSGSAWVTQSNDMEDHFLQPGQTLRLRRGPPVLIGAEQDVSLAFEAGDSLGRAALALLRGWWTRRGAQPAAKAPTGAATVAG